MLCVRERLYDMYIMCQESHYVCVFFHAAMSSPNLKLEAFDYVWCVYHMFFKHSYF